MATKHSPGPFTLETGVYPFQVMSADGLLVAEVCDEDIDQEEPTGERVLPEGITARTRADLNLLAAAPDLLAFVAKCAANGYADSTLGDVADDARALIQKALLA